MKIFNKTNKWFLSLFLSVTFSLSSCVELGEDPGLANLSPSSLNSEEALEALVTGMYRALHDGARWSDFFIAGYGGDDITTHSGSNKAGFRDADWRKQTASSERISNAYSAPYNTIKVANTIIENRDGFSGEKANLDRLIGEAYFMRGWSYFHLTRTFGEIPLQLSTTVNSELQKASFQQIYEQIEDDFEAAENLLPNVYPGIEAVGVRPGKGAAKAYLAKLYLHWAGFPLEDNAKYADAASKAKEVIDGESTYGYELAINFRSIWTEAGRFDHNEGVFTLVSCNECGRSNRTTGRLGLPGDAGGWTETFGEIAFYEDFSIAATANQTEQRFADTYANDVLPRGDMPDASDWANFSNEPHPIFRKVVGGDYAETINTTANDMNRYFMRYAEVLLIYAEASARSGSSSSDAWESLNRVRRRAGATSDVTSGDLAELAFEERAWELAGEYERWHDLVRLNRIASAFANRSAQERVDVVNSTVPATSGPSLYFTPIPQSEVDLAPQLSNTN